MIQEGVKKPWKNPHNSFTFKGKVNPKIIIISSFTHPCFVPKLYDFHFSAEYKNREILISVQKHTETFP